MIAHAYATATVPVLVAPFDAPVCRIRTHDGDARCAARRNTSFHEQMLKKNEQIYKLLAICVAMCPSVERWLDDAVKEHLHKKCGDDQFQMQNGSMEHFRKAFSYGCPRFITALPPDLSDAREDNSRAGFHDALRRFMSEVCPRMHGHHVCTSATDSVGWPESAPVAQAGVVRACACEEEREISTFFSLTRGNAGLSLPFL